MSMNHVTGFGALDIDPREIEEHLAAGYTLPAEFYFDPQIHRLEQELLFRPTWHFGCLERDVANPGDFFTTSVGNVPVVVVRDRDGELRAHVNVCRHRGHPVAAGEGNRKVLQCRYHGWTYDLTGSLRGAPRCAAGEIEFESHGLLPAHADTWAGMVFVSLEPREPLATALGDLPRVMEQMGYDFPFATDDELELYDRFEMRLNCNWKVAWENAIECYHCPTIHKSSLAQYYNVRDEDFIIGEFDRGFYNLGYFKEGVAERLGLSDEVGFAFSTYWLFPSTSFTGGIQNGAVVSRFYPVGPEEGIRVFLTYKRPGDQESDLAELADALRRTLQEDEEVVADVQRGLRSASVRYGRILPESESTIRHFHRLMWNELASAYDGQRASA